MKAGTMIGDSDMLTVHDITTYERDGLLVLPGLFDAAEIGALRASFDRDARIPGAHRIAEPHSDEVRAVYASHQRQPEYEALIRSSRLLRPAQQLLGPDVYLYQMKINSKPGFGGDGWSWHQDFPAWQMADSVAAPDLINAVVFLDEVTEYNGPIIFAPGSHLTRKSSFTRSADHRSEQHLDPDDIALTAAEMAECVDEHGLVSPKGAAGTVVFFHPELVHGSATNMSPNSRRVAIVTYNRTDNLPRPDGEPRAEYLVGRDTRPLSVLDDLRIVATA
jgi:ectoine hydroxylase